MMPKPATSQIRTVEVDATFQGGAMMLLEQSARYVLRPGSPVGGLAFNATLPT